MAAPESGLLVLSSRFVPLLSPVQITKQNHNKVKKIHTFYNIQNTLKDCTNLGLKVFVRIHF